MTDPSPAQTAAQAAIDDGKAQVAAAAARRPWTVIAWSAAAGALVGFLIAWVLL